MKRKKKKKPFKHVTLHEKLLQELESFKGIVGQELGVKRFISNADVIKVFIKHYKDYLRTVYTLNQKLLVGNKLEKNNLSVTNSITPKPYSASVTLDGKHRVSFSLEG